MHSQRIPKTREALIRVESSLQLQRKAPKTVGVVVKRGGDQASNSTSVLAGANQGQTALHNIMGSGERKKNGEKKKRRR